MTPACLCHPYAELILRIGDCPWLMVLLSLSFRLWHLGRTFRSLWTGNGHLAATTYQSWSLASGLATSDKPYSGTVIRGRHLRKHSAAFSSSLRRSWRDLSCAGKSAIYYPESWNARNPTDLAPSEALSYRDPCTGHTWFSYLIRSE